LAGLQTPLNFWQPHLRKWLRERARPLRKQGAQSQKHRPGKRLARKLRRGNRKQKPRTRRRPAAPGL